MSISWSQGLLAGAAGVAEYSQQEKARRQQRIDRTNELQNAMRLEQAKSKYALQLDEYSRNKSVLKSLASVPSEDTYTEQLILFKTVAGMDDKAASRAATAAANGMIAKLKRPEAIPAPSFASPAMLQNQARSPIGDWVARYTGGPENQPEVEEAPSVPQDPTVPQAPSVPQDPSTPQVPQTTSPTQSISSVGSLQDPLADPEEWITNWERTDKDKKRVVMAQQSTASGKARIGAIFELGDNVPEDADLKFVADGQETVVWAKDKGSDILREVQRLPSMSPSGSGSDSVPKAEIASTSEVDAFLTNTDNKDSAAYTQLLPWLTVAQEGVFSDKYDAETQAIKKREYSNAYVSHYRNLVKQHTARDAAKYAKRDQMEANGYAYANVFEPKQIVEMLTLKGSTALNPEIFFNTDPYILDAILKELPAESETKPIKDKLDGYRRNNIKKE